MRNLLEHPIDKTEVVIVLDRCIAEASNQNLLGDTRPMILAAIRLLMDERFNEEGIRKYFLIPAA